MCDCTQYTVTVSSGCLQGRCAAVLLFHHQLALLPSTGADSLEAVVNAGGLSQPSTLGSSYTVNLAKLGVKEVHSHLASGLLCSGITQPVLHSTILLALGSLTFLQSL